MIKQTNRYLNRMLAITSLAYWGFITDANASESGTKAKKLVSTGIGVLFLFGFLWGIILIWKGCKKKADGDSGAWNCIIAGLILVAAPLIMGIFYAVAGMEAGVSEASFDF